MVSLIILGLFIVFYTLKAFVIAPLVAAQRKRCLQEKAKEEAYMHNDMAKFIENQSNIISDKNPWLNPKDNFGKLERGKV